MKSWCREKLEMKDHAARSRSVPYGWLGGLEQTRESQICIPVSGLPKPLTADL